MGKRYDILKTEREQTSVRGGDSVAEQEMLGRILSEIQSVKTDMQELKTDVQELKTDVQELKTDVQELKTDVQELKTDVQGLKTDVQELKTDVQELKDRTTRVEILLENVIPKRVDLLGEQQSSFVRRLDILEGYDIPETKSTVAVIKRVVSSHSNRLAALEKRRAAK